jgi:protein-tyrosine phosphatase
MAQAMLSRRLTAQGASVRVASAGLLAGGRQPPPEVISVMAAREIDVAGHRSRRVTAADLAAADLIVGLSREHVRHAVVLVPQSWPRAFTLRELLRRGLRAGARAHGQSLGTWLARAAGDRSRRDLLGGGRADDVPDPYGGPLAGYQATARLLDGLTRDLAALAWPS